MVVPFRPFLGPPVPPPRVPSPNERSLTLAEGALTAAVLLAAVSAGAWVGYGHGAWLGFLTFIVAAMVMGGLTAEVPLGGGVVLGAACGIIVYRLALDDWGATPSLVVGTLVGVLLVLAGCSTHRHRKRRRR